MIFRGAIYLVNRGANSLSFSINVQTISYLLLQFLCIICGIDFDKKFLIDNSSSFWHNGNRSSSLPKNLFLYFCMFLPYFLKQSLIRSFLCQILFYYGSSAYNNIAVVLIYLYNFNINCLPHKSF